MPCPLMAADDHPAEGQGADRHQAAEPGHPPALPGSGDVRTAQDGVAHDPGDGPARCAGAGSPGRAEAGTLSAGLLMTTPFTPPRTYTNVENPIGPMTLRSDKSHK